MVTVIKEEIAPDLDAAKINVYHPELSILYQHRLSTIFKLLIHIAVYVVSTLYMQEAGQLTQIET